MKKLYFFALIGLFLSCSEDDDFERFSDSNYPTRYFFLSDAERGRLYEDFDYNLKTYFEIDSLGYLDRDWEVDRESELFEGNINSEELVLKVAREFLQKYSGFIGINDTSLLVVKRIQGNPRLEENKNRWFLQYENQVFNGIEVYNTQIGMYVSPQGIYETFGHWYPVIYLPKHMDVSFEEAKRNLVGKTFSWIGMAGEVAHTLTTDDLNESQEEEKVIFPFRKNDCYEMRLCWKIYTGIWNFYIDTMNGEIVEYEQNIIS